MSRLLRLLPGLQRVLVGPVAARRARLRPGPVLSRQARTLYCSPPARAADKPDTVNVTFEFPDGKQCTVRAKIGDNLLDTVLDNNVDIDGFGACEGTLACSTCHLVLPPDLYSAITTEVSDEEMDMLDLAFGLTDTSRLGCQCVVRKDYDGVVIKVPEGVNDQRAGD